MTFIMINKPIATCQCPSEVTARAICLFALQFPPCPFFSVPRGSDHCNLVSRELSLFGFQPGVVKWKGLGERVEGERKGEAVRFSPPPLPWVLSQKMAVVPSWLQPQPVTGPCRSSRSCPVAPAR